ncbi:hypothetical protein M0G74_02995 [Microbulbifer sp. CAU 1566]|uniref:hypothetical protein n=1 Tax=Microbulbifer sp. CAU 1566 TaxID=2933269 RepID=UPI002004E772|nr:hypothetical protein [Microbulbifer sp. CAU 1566]MCK7596232.1 hypothetical protein [Microbulbifer sp. CAU 1566]
MPLPSYPQSAVAPPLSAPRQMSALLTSTLLISTLLTACGADTTGNSAGTSADEAVPADKFLTQIAAYCGQAFAGQITANEPRSPEPDAFAGKPLVMHVRGCDAPSREIRIPFHVGEDHSRTWILTRTDSGLRLKHDHRHQDGSEDAVTMYGGDTQAAGTENRQEFPVDQESISTFTREGLNASLENTWAMEIHPGQYFVYELTRPNGRKFRVQFDLTKPVALPPTPWGY